MLGLTKVGELAGRLHTTPQALYHAAEHIDEYVELYELVDPANPSRKPRIVLSPRGPLRCAQHALLHVLFRKHLRPTRFSFGGIPGRNALQNARCHLASRFAYTTDIENFFPSISAERVREMFESRHGCSGDISRLLTRLCTYNHHLAQGMITSPILADESVRRIDFRIAGLCAVHNLVYSRFVDDVTVSGCFHLDQNSSGIVDLIRRILADCGFEIAKRKEQSGLLADGDVAITGLRVLRGHLDAAAEYVRRLEEHLEAHRLLGLGHDSAGPLFTEDQLRGRVAYVCAVNCHRSRILRQRLGQIDWPNVKVNAISRGLIVCRRGLKHVPKLCDAR
jgi:hypothetical protein